MKDLLGQDRFKQADLPTIVTPKDLQNLGGNNLKEQVAFERKKQTDKRALLRSTPRSHKQS